MLMLYLPADFVCFKSLLKQDENRYNASRGAHLNLKRAEKARILVNKIPGMFRTRDLPWSGFLDLAVFVFSII